MKFFTMSADLSFENARKRTPFFEYFSVSSIIFGTDFLHSGHHVAQNSTTQTLFLRTSAVGGFGVMYLSTGILGVYSPIMLFALARLGAKSRSKAVCSVLNSRQERNARRYRTVDTKAQCAKCSGPVCLIPGMAGPDEFCVTRTKTEAIDRATRKMLSPENKEMARVASIQEGQGYMRLPFAPKGPSPIKTRLEEVIEFSKKMGFQKLGVAYCGGVQADAARFVGILESRGFAVVSVSCHCGAVAKEVLGLSPDERVWPERLEAMCHPIAQAEILNDEDTDFNIMFCLCIGHDTLFLKHSKAPCTVFAVKDRVLGHNPMAALWVSGTYYRRVLSKETIPISASELKTVR